jgi:hypothetical protein
MVNRGIARDQTDQMPASRSRSGWLIRSQIEGGHPPQLSIIVVTRRDFGHLRHTLHSLQPFFLPGVEIVVIEGDDVDCDESAAVREWLSDTTACALWCQRPDGGIYDGMNRGILASSGKWLWFVNSGDSPVQGLQGETLLAALQEQDAETMWVIGQHRVVDDMGRELMRMQAPSYDAWHDQRDALCHQAVLVRREAVAVTGLFDTSYRISADYRMFLQLSRLSAPAFIPIGLVEFLSGGYSESAAGRRERENARVRREQLNLGVGRSCYEYARALRRTYRSMRQGSRLGLSGGGRG